MRRFIITVCLLGSAGIVLQTSDVNVANSIILFVLAGVVPGTNLLVPASVVLMTVSVIAFVIIASFVATHVSRYIAMNRIARSQYIVTKRGVVRRRPVRA